MHVPPLPTWSDGPGTEHCGCRGMQRPGNLRPEPVRPPAPRARAPRAYSSDVRGGMMQRLPPRPLPCAGNARLRSGRPPLANRTHGSWPAGRVDLHRTFDNDDMPRSPASPGAGGCAAVESGDARPGVSTRSPPWISARVGAFGVVRQRTASLRSCSVERRILTTGALCGSSPPLPLDGGALRDSTGSPDFSSVCPRSLPRSVTFS